VLSQRSRKAVLWHHKITLHSPDIPLQITPPAPNKRLTHAILTTHCVPRAPPHIPKAHPPSLPQRNNVPSLRTRTVRRPLPPPPPILTPRNRQNNSRLDELASKVSALRGVTIDIYDNARDQSVLDSTSDTFSSFSTSLKGSASRLTRMAQSGNKVAILKLSGMLIAGIVVLYWIGSWFF
jgi:blocked-early-in-transport protein 1